MWSAERLRSLIPAGGLGEDLYYYPSVGSTNDRAKELAEAGCPTGTVVVADEQTAGRGRAGRGWFTPAGAALAFSVVLRPPEAPADDLAPSGPRAPARRGETAGWTAVGALSVRDGLAALGAEAEIKWPNDVLLARRKAAGVLAEAAWRADAPTHVVIGIGVNVTPDSVPGPRLLDYPATCVETHLGHPVDRADLLAGILASLERWTAGFRLSAVLAAWEASLAFRGESVHVEGEGRAWQGQLSGLGPRGELRLRLDNGDSLLLPAGVMHLRPVDSGPV